MELVKIFLNTSGLQAAENQEKTSILRGFYIWRKFGYEKFVSFI